MVATPQDIQAYWVDAFQRSILYLDIMRERGNQFIEHYKAGKPPVLVFDYDVVVDGESLERPCNYMLLAIKPPADKPTDPKKRPFVVFDPRAGHGPGIGGSKEASQVGVALNAGHPVYFVSFRPNPVPGQTLRDVARAEKHFLDVVIARHPEAEAKPAIIGNCQAGWAIMMLSAYAPEQSSVIAIAGSPLSYWAGIEGKDPMRYFGGLLGGNWSAALLADIGAGIFDGANLDANFENLNPANTLIGKPYNLYSKVDTERERFLNFERWWGGYFLMAKNEMIELTSELFIGNKLAAGKILASDGTPLDLRAIRAPIVVIASQGDNITPPAQALNWILDLYDDVDEMRANEQTIVYTVHPTIGHLGIFVSAKVAVKEYSEFVNSLELIESLPPGLFEMVVDEVKESGDADKPLEFTVHFEARTLDDIRRYDDGREDEEAFRAVARFSEINEGLYETFMSPMVKAMSNDGTAELLRWLHPQRLNYTMYADINPWMAGIKAMAETVRENRAEAPADNPLRVAEEQAVRKVESALEAATVQRDLLIERMFKTIYGNPMVRALAGEAATFGESKKPSASHRRAFRDLAELKLQNIAARESEGSFTEAVLRVIYAAIKAKGRIDARAFADARQAKIDNPRFAKLSRDAFMKEAREAAFMVAIDEDAALESLPNLLPDMDDRREACALVRRIMEMPPQSPPEAFAVLERVERILGVAPGGTKALSAPKGAPVQTSSGSGKAETDAVRNENQRK